MKNCQDIRADLSAYIDRELSPSQRAEIEAHIASCSRCQANVVELKKLAAGMAALPKLQPAPRFLTEVRRKIAEGREPAESISWREHLFRPLWLKVPLEAAALVVIGMLVVSVVRPRPPGGVSTFVTANGPAVILSGSSGGSTHAVGAPAALQSATAARTVSSTVTVAGQVEQRVEPLAQTGSRANLDDNKVASEDHRRIPAVANSVGELALESTSNSDVAAWAQNFGIDQSKLRDVLTVEAKDAGDVRSRAEQLVAKCKGKIIPGVQSTDATGQVFFVELPWECAAGFKAGLLQNPSGSALAANGVNRDKSVVMRDGVAGSGGGELTGAALTNDTDRILYRIRLGVDVKPASSTTTVLEIRVVPPSR